MPELVSWTPSAWSDYEYWQGQDRKTLKRINALIKDCLREPFAGIGKPEPLKENLRTSAKLHAAATNHMAFIETNPERVKSYFQDPRVKYAA